MGKIFKTQKIWGYWFFDADGRRHQISLDTKEQDEADRWREVLDASQKPAMTL
jgi:hypothetical protein